MSKVVAGMAAVVLGGGAATGAVILLPKWLNGADAELPDNLTSLAKEAHTKGCMPSMFRGLTDVSKASGTVATSDVNENFFEANKKTEGCLVVNWDKRSKTEESATKWSGTLRFLWAVRGESKGFLMLLVGTTSEASEKKLKWEGTAYILEKENESWSAKKKQDAASSTKHFDKNTSEEGKFPKPGDALEAAKSRSFWGFFASKDDLDNVNTVDESGVKSSYRGYWTWRGGDGEGTQNMDGWTKELDKWWEAIFTKTNWDMGKAVKDKQGKWTQGMDRLKEGSGRTA